MSICDRHAARGAEEDQRLSGSITSAASFEHLVGTGDEISLIADDT
jgi:hypothetical protein